MKQKMNLPNKITVFRMIIVLFIVVLFLVKESFPNYFEQESHLFFFNLVIFISFLSGSISDFVDGNIARKRNIVTTFGKFLDPIADKLLVNSLFIILTGLGQIHWLVTVIMVGRDIIVDVIRLIMVEKNVVIAASKLGKLKTVFQMISLVILLAAPVILPGNTLFLDVAIYLTYVAAFVSLISGLDYFMKNKKVLLADMKV